MTFADRVAEAIAHSKKQPADIARECKVSSSAVSQWLDGTTQTMKADSAELFQTATGYLSRWVRTGLGPKLAGGIRADGLGVSIPLLPVSASMGAGEDQPDDETAIAALSLSVEWATQHAADIGVLPSLRFIYGTGKSMQPTFDDGDVLLVNAAVREVVSGGVFVLVVNGKLYIKRVTRLFNDQLQVSSDNPTEKTVQVLDGSQTVEVLGRVVWRWNGAKV